MHCSTLHLTVQDCTHCYSGPARCRGPDRTSCPPIQEDYGGTWYSTTRPTCRDCVLQVLLP